MIEVPLSPISRSPFEPGTPPSPLRRPALLPWSQQSSQVDTWAPGLPRSTAARLACASSPHVVISVPVAQPVVAEDGRTQSTSVARWFTAKNIAWSAAILIVAGRAVAAICMLHLSPLAAAAVIGVYMVGTVGIMRVEQQPSPDFRTYWLKLGAAVGTVMTANLLFLSWISGATIIDTLMSAIVGAEISLGIAAGIAAAILALALATYGIVSVYQYLAQQDEEAAGSSAASTYSPGALLGDAHAELGIPYLALAGG